MQQITKTKLFRVLLIALFFLGFVFFSPTSISNPARSLFSSIIAPFQKVTYSFAMGVGNIRDFIFSIGQLKQENERLLKEKQILLAQNASLHDLETENSNLRQQLEILPRDQYEMLAANVIGQDPNGMGNWLQIDKGSEDGLSEGMVAVVSKSVVVGKIQDVTAHSSKVILLTNPKNMLNVMTAENGSKGVVKGEYGLGIIFDMILQTDSLQVGNNVITSGVGGQVPKGLYVGTVQEIHSSSDHLFQQAVVTSPLEISKLQFVFVIKKNK